MASDRSDFDARDVVRSDVELGEIGGGGATKKTRSACGVRKVLRRGKRVLVIDIRYQVPNGPNKGKPARYRRDAEVQTWEGARAELKRRLAALATTGSPYEIVHPVARASVIREPPAFTFGDAIDEWLSDYVPTLKAATQFGYQSIAQNHLSSLRNIPLHEFGTEHIRTLQKRDREAGRSLAVTNHTYACIRSVIKFALEKKRLKARPELPSVKRTPDPEIETYTDAEVQALIDACESHDERLIILLVCYAGLRTAEVRGLRWRDVDLQRGTLTVRQAISRGPGKDGKGSAMYAEKPKSGKERTIPLHALLHRELSAVEGRAPGALVCASPDGKPYGAAGIYDVWDRIRERANVRRISWMVHAGRHYFGTALCRARVNVRAVQKLLGHADLKMTMRYVHAVSKDLQDAIGDLEALTMRAPKEDD